MDVVWRANGGVMGVWCSVAWRACFGVVGCGVVWGARGGVAKCVVWSDVGC